MGVWEDGTGLPSSPQSALPEPLPQDANGARRAPRAKARIVDGERRCALPGCDKAPRSSRSPFCGDAHKQRHYRNRHGAGTDSRRRNVVEIPASQFVSTDDGMAMSGIEVALGIKQRVKPNRDPNHTYRKPHRACQGGLTTRLPSDPDPEFMASPRKEWRHPTTGAATPTLYKRRGADLTECEAAAVREFEGDERARFESERGRWTPPLAKALEVPNTFEEPEW